MIKGGGSVINGTRISTAGGIKGGTTILLVTVDGRGYNGSVGVYIEEPGLIMKYIGATDAINMDGGGSTTAAYYDSAGTIMVTSKHRIKGLTTAAGLWAAACLGLVIGCGFYVVAASAFAVLLATMLLADKLELVLYRKLRRLNLGLIVSSLDEVKEISAAMEVQGVLLTLVELTESLSSEGIALSCVARLKSRISHDEVIRMLLSLDGVIFAERLDL